MRNVINIFGWYRLPIELLFATLLYIKQLDYQKRKPRIRITMVSLVAATLLSEWEYFLIIRFASALLYLYCNKKDSPKAAFCIKRLCHDLFGCILGIITCNKKI
jgi:hypothetical protein